MFRGLGGKQTRGTPVANPRNIFFRNPSVSQNTFFVTSPVLFVVSVRSAEPIADQEASVFTLKNK